MNFSNSRRLPRVWATAALTIGLSAPLAAAQELVLYENDFESPNRPVTVDCGNSLDQTGINASYGRPGYSFVEDFTVETVVLHDPAGKYADPGPRNGRYALGMLGELENDRLALRFDLQSQQFLNLTMDVSSIDIDGCGGPFGVQTPRFKLTLLDSPDGVFDWNAEKLDEKLLEGEPAANGWSFAWSRASVALDASGATDGNVILVFDLVSQGYAAFDNLLIEASRLPVVADRDEDGAADSTDNCPHVANGNQANGDQDSAGDACDPAPLDPERCGDRSGDGADDCHDFCEAHPVSSCTAAGAGSSAAGRGARGDAGRGGSPSEHDADAGTDEGGGEADDDDDSPRLWGGGGPSGSDDDEPADGGGCEIALAHGGSIPVAVFWLSAAWVLYVRRRRR